MQRRRPRVLYRIRDDHRAGNHEYAENDEAKEQRPGYRVDVHAR
jgi:hypothetical protein